MIYRRRLRGILLRNRRMRVYCFKTYERMTFTEIGRKFNISRQAAAQDYYIVLRNDRLRDIANQWRNLNARYVPQSYRS